MKIASFQILEIIVRKIFKQIFYHPTFDKNFIGKLLITIKFGDNTKLKREQNSKLVELNMACKK